MIDIGTVTPKNLEAEVVVVGGGGAGLAAAVAAAEGGAKVIVLEKRRKTGGNSVYAEGLFAAESPAQRRASIDARRDELFKIAMNYAHWGLNARVVRAFIDKSGDTIRWLEEKGLRFDWIPPFSPRHDHMLRVFHCPQKGGPAIIKTLVKNCTDLGVQVLCNTAAERLVTDEAGKVTGVLAKTGESKFQITARSIVIATGGFGGNKELLKKYCPVYNEEFLTPGLPHMGDGILMATDIGAATEGLGRLHLSAPYFPRSRIIFSTICEPNTLWVNKRGERFTDESTGLNGFESVNSIIRQPGKISYAIIDDEIVRNIMHNGYVRVYLGILYGRKVGPIPGLEKELQRQAGKGRVKISDSCDQIATWIGAEPEVLQSTIDEYNSCCDQGYDPVFAKERRYLQALRTPPYYAIKCYPAYLSTMGGIRINEHMEAVDEVDDPIPGLFAAGTDTGGWESDTYCVLLSGSTFGFAINSGRIAGENAAKYALGK